MAAFRRVAGMGQYNGKKKRTKDGSVCIGCGRKTSVHWHGRGPYACTYVDCMAKLGVWQEAERAVLADIDALATQPAASVVEASGVVSPSCGGGATPNTGSDGGRQSSRDTPSRSRARSALERVQELEGRVAGMDLRTPAALAGSPAKLLSELFAAADGEAAAAPPVLAPQAVEVAALSTAILNDPDSAAAERAAAQADEEPLCLLAPVQWVQYALFLERRVLGVSSMGPGPTMDCDPVFCHMLLSHRAREHGVRIL